jgi:hypothetical protein
MGSDIMIFTRLPTDTELHIYACSLEYRCNSNQPDFYYTYDQEGSSSIIKNIR